MSNLFSIFDPSSFSSLPLNWISVLIFIYIIPMAYWTLSSQISQSLKIFMKFLKQEFTAILTPAFIPGTYLLTSSLLIFILMNNLMGLLPYIFTTTSHLVFTMTLALPLWLGHILIAWTKIYNLMFAHLVPLGTPYVLTPFMVVIEIISSIIRPLTLSVRLAANMIAGHLLMAILSNNATPTSNNLSLMIIILLLILGLLEFGVAIIQSYVFSVLSTLYISEVSELNYKFLPLHPNK